jgi:heat shock 70kDa protein 1/2/6/8
MATQDAGKIAGLNVLRIINEPTAASLAFDIENRTVDDRNILVFDFGGGTFDVTVLCIGDGVNEVKSTSGDTHLGGQDLDTKFVEYCVQQFKEKTMIDLSNDKSALSRLREKCKKVKELLSSETEAKFTILGLAQSKDLDFSITRAKFEQICDPIFKKLLPPITEALEHANLTKKDI